ncbi:hypothetical protein NAI31_10805 [Francisella tularensis subsp. holarctica]|uniref:hypothetical protein n=1 Tax=Francisella tularensis TaxID=263 RepID=UPI002381BF3A|nr:hypothetical protein [Francisella tularensis]MDE4949096.1 hypothetical protein [Francisella tularensis subsp. holarctica]
MSHEIKTFAYTKSEKKIKKAEKQQPDINKREIAIVCGGYLAQARHKRGEIV